MAQEESSAGTGPFLCPKCRATTSGRSAFCPECGEPLDMQCPTCGLTWRFYVHYSFCPSCGQRVPEKVGITRVKGWG